MVSTFLSGRLKPNSTANRPTNHRAMIVPNTSQLVNYHAYVSRQTRLSAHQILSSALYLKVIASCTPGGPSHMNEIIRVTIKTAPVQKHTHLIGWIVPIMLLLALTACGGGSSSAGAPATTPHNVIVVGAGAAGLSAARALHNAGADVIVLEARDRIGGRIHTAVIDQAPVDLGASWMVGSSAENPLFAYADANLLPYELYQPFPAQAFDAVLNTFVSFTATGADTRRFLNQLPSLRASLGDTASLQDGVSLFLQQQDYDADTHRLMQFALEQWLGELEYAGPVDAMSLEWFYRDDGFGSDNYAMTGGLVSLVDHMAQPLDIRLNQVVDHIEYSATGVTVYAGANQYSGTHAILTVPLGVLKSGTIGFTPPLSARKLEALAQMDMGNLEKVVLRFAEKTWDDIGYLYVQAPPNQGTMPFYIDATPIANTLPTLVAFYGGNTARTLLANETEQQIVDTTIAQLESMLGSSLPTPVATYITRWTEDSYSRGSYSYVPVGGSLNNNAILSEPLERLLFAGEASSDQYPATVHGAMLSGLREAQRILPNAQL